MIAYNDTKSTSVLRQSAVFAKSLWFAKCVSTFLDEN